MTDDRPSRKQWDSSLPARAQPLPRGQPPARRTRVKARNEKRGGHRFPKTVDKKYREWIRYMSCCNCGHPGPSHPHHVKTRGAGGADRGNLVPLCPFCHQEVHAMGRRTFAMMFECDLPYIAKELDKQYERGEAPW